MSYWGVVLSFIALVIIYITSFTLPAVDENRVKLSATDEGYTSDYVNASHIKVSNQPLFAPQN